MQQQAGHDQPPRDCGSGVALGASALDAVEGVTAMREGIRGNDEVILEIKSNQAEYGEAAGITATDLKNLLTADEQYA
ncbi:MAG: hypothetical protein ACMG6S_33115, partial [Byssovorax sp.]